jgi:small subunit ribosomal protein S6
MTTTRRYEAFIILKPAGTDQDLAQATAKLEDVVQRLGGRVARSESFGRRRLAFRIGRQTEGHYHLLQFDAPTQQVAELERLLRLNETVVRFIILSEEELALEPAQPVGGGSAHTVQPSTLPRS